MSHTGSSEKRNAKASENEDLPRPPTEAEDWAPLSPLGTEGCQWDEYYPHLDDDEDNEDVEEK